MNAVRTSSCPPRTVTLDEAAVRVLQTLWYEHLNAIDHPGCAVVRNLLHEATNVRPCYPVIGMIFDRIVEAWPSIAGFESSLFSHPTAIVGSSLCVEVASSEWSHQLAFLERDILRAIHDLQPSVIERLRFRVRPRVGAPA